MDTPASLLQRLRQPGQQQAWARFVRLYTPLLYYWARRAGCQEADAADLVQEVLTLLVRKLPEFHYDGQKSFRRWLHTVTLNKWREGRRRASGTPVQETHGIPDVAGPDDLGAFEETEYRNALVRRALEALRPEFSSLSWKAFQEHVVSGRDAAEVAADLQVRVGTVYAAKSRVLGRLRQELAGLLD
jgi:RNA polymerase sigma-70 factor (ECF subfamily)